VFRALVGYGIAAFAVLQIVERSRTASIGRCGTLLRRCRARGWFPVVVALAWIFDVSAGRIERAPAAGLRGCPSLPCDRHRHRGGRAGLFYFFVVRSPARTMSAPASIAVLHS